MTKTQIMGLILITGSIIGFIAIVMSLLWNWLHQSFILSEPAKDKVFNSLEVRWDKRRKLLDGIRFIGLFCLYFGMLAMIVGAAGFGIALIEGY